MQQAPDPACPVLHETAAVAAAARALVLRRRAQPAASHSLDCALPATPLLGAFAGAADPPAANRIIKVQMKCDTTH